MKLSAPAPLTGQHETASLSCGTESLDQWLQRRAWKNQLQGASRTYVVCEERQVVAYYALASGAVATVGATGKLRRNMPDPIPVVVLGRLAVDSRLAGRGVGRALIRDAGLRVLQAADAIGVRGVVVQALSDDARRFYLKVGFDASPLEPNLLMITLADLRDCV
jgi:GNAT superfamily N-acetyltransferase